MDAKPAETVAASSTDKSTGASAPSHDRNGASPLKNPSEQRGAKRRKKTADPQLITRTIRNTPWGYLHLELTTTATTVPPLDILTARTSLTAALTQFLGLTGSAMPIDILKVEGRDCWIRVAREDLNAVAAAVGGWVGGGQADAVVGWRVKGKAGFLGELIGQALEREIWAA
ncbi:MAG: hypothetical protein M1837_006330 [Sclerophora amabilis]|nr:MAG: hypothetical protein M1837_006330 [Sclerophora amabilis]